MQKSFWICAAVVWATNASADDVAESCRACHRDALSLASWSAEALVRRIEDIRAGRVDHMVPMPDLSDERLRALAAELAGRAGPG